MHIAPPHRDDFELFRQGCYNSQPPTPLVGFARAFRFMSIRRIGCVYRDYSAE